MNWVDHYLRASYRDGARGPDEYDCWGLVREVRSAIYGKRLLPSWGHVRHDMAGEFTRAYREEAEQMAPCAPEVGAIACVFRGSLCLHVAVVVEIDGELAILEMNPKRNCCWSRIPAWESRHLKFAYYRDQA